MKRLIKTIIIVGIIIGSLFFIIHLNINIAETQDDSILNDLEPFLEALSIVRSEYIEKDIPITKLVEGAIKGMLLELDDPYSRYLDPISFQREQENIFMGHFDGLGITVTIVDEQLTVISPIEDTPAYHAGIKANDKIMKIDGESTKGITLDEAVNILRGEKGTPVTLTIKRENIEDLLEITIIRDTITVDAVKEKLLEDEQLGYIRISTFNANTAPELKEVLNNFKEIPLEGIILDLRNNPGGLLESAIEVASQFIREGDIVQIKGRNDLTRSYKSYGHKYPDWPLVLLINKGSASASEIVAGAIQDYGRGIIMGEQSFGKGLVQQVYPLSDGSAITISTSEYYTPKGRIINNIGIKPDIIIPIEEEQEEDIQLKAAIDILLEERIKAQ
ncbi:MAG: S41 family peptidase [Atribacterota bacterium]|jgi:carboxyl-terminal processing protease|nr:S41 family peptidase [Atribacterota bacterium]